MKGHEEEITMVLVFWFFLGFFFVIMLIVYQKGDLVKQPMKSRDVLPKNVPGVGGVKVDIRA